VTNLCDYIATHDILFLDVAQSSEV